MVNGKMSCKLQLAMTLQAERDQAGSVSLGDRMVVIGGQSSKGDDIVSDQVEIYNSKNNTWDMRLDLSMKEGRYSFCAVPG